MTIEKNILCVWYFKINCFVTRIYWQQYKVDNMNIKSINQLLKLKIFESSVNIKLKSFHCKMYKLNCFFNIVET